jgi:MFS family permease
MLYTLVLSVYEPTAISFMSFNKAVSQGVLVGVRQTIVGLGMTVGFIVGGILYGVDKLYVFYFAVLFYIIVLAGFTVLIRLQRKQVKEYRSSYLEEVRNND